MVVHLITNASVVDSPATFQKSVYLIHSLGSFLPIIEWGLIFIPLLFHAIFGVVIIAGGLPNTTAYPYESNVRYTLQRVSGMIAFVFIVWHVFHMHGWFHTEWWLANVAEPLGGAQFKAYNASSTAGAALASVFQVIVYTIGLLASIFHLANGIWTAGITWGLWLTPSAQGRAGVACWVFGVALSVVGMTALIGMARVDQSEAVKMEGEMRDAAIRAHLIPPDDHKTADPRKSAKSHASPKESKSSSDKAPITPPAHAPGQ
jgi:succinate dehydrogenase / fumarate reductase cytochrome b subunit